MSWSSLLSPASATNAACLRASAANVVVRTSGTQTCSGRRPRSRILRRYSPTLSLTVTPLMLHVTARKGTVAAVPAPHPQQALFCYFYKSMTIRSAALTRRISSKLRCPTLSPSRLGSTAAACSASTRVARPAISTSGRKLATRAAVDVGATNNVDNGSSSDWMTTAYRVPDCSWPRLPRGARSRKISPRTQRLHVAKYLRCFRAVDFVRCKFLSLGAD
jgi:hypothetical protein